LFTVNDADNDTMTFFGFYDATSGGGRFELNGVAQAANQNIYVTASQLSQLAFHAGAPGSDDDLFIAAYDGTGWSTWKEFHISQTRNNDLPVVSASDRSASSGQLFAANTLFTVSDSDNDSMTVYGFYDATSAGSSGHFELNGTSLPAEQNIYVSAAQLSQLAFRAGGPGSHDDLFVAAYDGTGWSTWSEFHIDTPNSNHLPVVSAASRAAISGQQLGAGSLFSVSDADHDAITMFGFYDATSSGSSGHFELNGVPLSASQNIYVTPSQLGQLTFRAGSPGSNDQLYVAAYDGFGWSTWTEFHVNTVVVDNFRPTVSAQDRSVTTGQTVAASSLFSASDPENDLLTWYGFYDATTGASSGRFELNGVAQPAAQNIYVHYSQLSELAFRAGSFGANDDLFVAAYDGTNWSTWKEFHLFASDILI
jgi:hypothetical protein